MATKCFWSALLLDYMFQEVRASCLSNHLCPNYLLTCLWKPKTLRARQFRSIWSWISETLSNFSGHQTVITPDTGAPPPHLGVQTRFLLWITQAYHEDLGLFIRTQGKQFLHAHSYTSILLNPRLFNFPRSRKPFIALICRCDQRLMCASKCHFKIIHFWDKMESRLIYPLRVTEFCSLPVYLAPSLYSFISAFLFSYLLMRFRFKDIPPNKGN